VRDDLVNDPRLTIVGLLLEAHGGLVAELGAVHAAHGLAGTDFDVLLRLARSAGRRLRMSDLAAQTQLSTSGITRIVDRLERRGFVQRDLSPADRRACWTVLTDDGQQILNADLLPLLDMIQKRFIDAFDPDQLEKLTEGLRRLRDALHPAAAAGSLGASVSPGQEAS
jgi:DNA-binding MarR family transcriptional regulator